MQELESTRRIRLFAGIALACLVALVFWPIVGFEFVDLDVRQQVIDNPHIRGLTGENLKHILTSRSISSYYPVRTLTYALDYQFWGLNPAGFKLTNGLIHLANVLLVFWLVLRLFRHPASVGGSPGASWDVAVATFSAGLFAVHPVVVEPVAWVAGREELLMTLGALGCIHFYITARQMSEKGGRTPAALVCYAGAALCCGAACLSNAVAAVIPLLITAWDVLTLARPTLWRILRNTGVLWVIGIATIVVKRVCEFLDLSDTAEPLFSIQRLMLVLKVYWLNVKTLVWPTGLAVSHDWTFPQNLLEREVVLGGIALALTCVVLWKLRQRKLILFGLVWFGLALTPSSQMMPHHIDRADRFLYLPLVGLVVAAALGLRSLGNVLKGRRIAAVVALGAALLLLLGAASAFQVQKWRNDVAMWGNCVRLDPDNAQLRCGFADSLAGSGQYRQAIQQCEKALQLNPDYGVAMIRLARLLTTCEEKQFRDYRRAIQLAERAFQKNRLHFRALARVYSRFAEALADDRKFGPAIEYYRRAIHLDPGSESALFGLAKLLATCSEKELRSPEEAVRLAKQACQLTDPPTPDGLSILATAYAEAGRFDMAITTVKRAVERARAAGDAKLASRLQAELEHYQQQTRKGPTP